MPADKKYCLFDADEKIAEFNRQLQEDQHRQELKELQKNDPGPFPERPAEQTENR